MTEGERRLEVELCVCRGGVGREGEVEEKSKSTSDSP